MKGLVSTIDIRPQLNDTNVKETGVKLADFTGCGVVMNLSSMGVALSALDEAKTTDTVQLTKWLENNGTAWINGAGIINFGPSKHLTTVNPVGKAGGFVVGHIIGPQRRIEIVPGTGLGMIPNAQMIPFWNRLIQSK